MHAIMVLEARPLNILFVVAYFPAPSQTYILNMMTGLLKKGHNITILAMRKNDVPGQPDIEKYGLMNRVIYEQLPEEKPECDIIFCQSGTLGRKIVENESLAAWIKDKKIIVCLRGLDVTGAHIRKDPTIYTNLFTRGDLFLPVCEYFKTLLIGYGCDPYKIHVHHSAIDCDKFFFQERTKEKKKRSIIHLVAVCRLIQKKGLEYAIKAVELVVKKNKYIHFTIVGSGHLQSYLEDLVKKLGLQNKVTFFGWATQEQVVKILNKSHIFLLPSTKSNKGDEEGIANALKEAMAMGLISIGTMHAGTPELIENGVSGYLVPEKDAKALAQKITYIVKNPRKWKAMSIAARKKIEAEFETKKSVGELEQIFYGLLK